MKAIDDALAALQSSFNVETADAQSVPDAATVMSAGSARTAGGTTVYKRVTARDIEAEAAAARAQLLQAAAGTARATSSRASSEGTHVDTRTAGAQSAHDDGDAGARDSDVARLLAPKEQIEALLRGLNAAGARESMHTVYEAPLPPVYE
ncbi:hypothetical protein EON68_01595 [archaeon]|nr:MAG: hypothetical protein EON68_01595 [archaeon]